MQFKFLIVPTELHGKTSMAGNCYVSGECTDEEKGREERLEKF
jgi:hypothetical protein